MIKAGIIGGAGYTGGELIRLLLHHPRCTIAFVQSRSQAGKKVCAVHSDLFMETELRFCADVRLDVDVLFLCLGHGESSAFLAKNKLPASVKIIDLAQDNRLNGQFVYGLPEVFSHQIRSANRVANPGCFATAIQLALLPLAQNKLLMGDVHISGITGSTGAGQQPSGTTHFSWRSSNVSVYKAFSHQHLAEIGQTLLCMQPGWKGALNFIPMRGNFTRGILVTAYMQSNLDLEQAVRTYQAFYKEAPFVYLSKQNPDVKQVRNTNNSLLHLEKHGENLLVVAVLDNLLKGASGQAVQNMNLMFGLEETGGLKLKPVAF